MMGPKQRLEVTLSTVLTHCQIQVTLHLHHLCFKVKQLKKYFFSAAEGDNEEGGNPRLLEYLIYI